MPRTALKVVQTEADELRALLNTRQRLQRETAENDHALRQARRRFADRRGEFILPTIERLRRELLP